MNKTRHAYFTNLLLIICYLTFGHGAVHAQFNLIANDRGASLYYSGKSMQVKTALEIVVDDSKNVCSEPFRLVTHQQGADIIVGTVGESVGFDQLIKKNGINVEGLQDDWEGFLIQVIPNKSKPLLFVLGSDEQGAAYGVLELSRLIGVSPWVWWADAVPEKKASVTLPLNYHNYQKPSVKFRGIFLNDEDWGLSPWSSNTFEPEAKALDRIAPAKLKGKRTIGPKTYAKIFELLLRLRANSIWPAMHETTVPFYFVQGNREVAEKYGIYIGASHAEPMARNSATEWDIEGKGPYNYLNNKPNIINYWTDRLKELGKNKTILTLGMRGKHDGAMQGVKSTVEYKDAFNRVVEDQTKLIETYINPDASRVPQVVIPYKEVLEVYQAGVKIPEYATLMWCDDNYGYLTHFPDEKERSRKGGNGVYYHISYWGRPHDYLWLSTTSPSLIFQQMNLAFRRGADRMWIVNVGDIKPGEYQTELFLDMAWNMEKVEKEGVEKHLSSWLSREYGENLAVEALPLMTEHYHLAYIRKPEFMGNTRVEESRSDYNIVHDLPWSESTIKQRLLDYENLAKRTAALEKQISSEKSANFFQLVAYPIYAAAEMNKKTLYGQLARHGKAEWEISDSAYSRILSLTTAYSGLNNGKWKDIMDYKPRNLPVFSRIPKVMAKGPLVSEKANQILLNGTDFTGPAVPLHGLGQGQKAVGIPKGSQLKYEVSGRFADSIHIEIRLLPGHPVEGNTLRFGIQIDKLPVQIVDYKTIGRSEEWKENVLRNQEIRNFAFPKNALKGKFNLIISALDEGVVLDQVHIY